MNGESSQDSIWHVLLVDDDATIRFLACQALEQAGITVSEASDGIQALAIYEQVKPDIILLDVKMPLMDGFTVCSKIRNHPEGHNIPIIMMTGHDDFESINRAYEMGATDFISKPLNWLILCSRVRYMLRASRTFQNLNKSEARLNYAQRIGRIGSWEWDVVNDQKYWSDTVYEILKINMAGFDKATQSIMDFVHPLDKEFVKLALEESLVGNIPFNIDHQVVLPDGTERYVHSEADIVTDKNGRVVRLIGIIQDITERKQAEKALQQSEAKQRAMIDNNVDVIGIADQDGICLYKSQNIIKWFGWHPIEVVGEVTWKNVHPDDQERFQRLFTYLKNVPNSSTTLEYRYRCKDGSYKWIECTAVNLLHDPEISGVFLNYHDISERKRSEEDLLREQLFSETIVDSLPGIFYLYTYPELRLIRWNKQHESLLGFETGEIEGRHITEWHMPEAKETVLAVVETVMKTGHDSIEAMLLAKDGSSVPFYLTGVKLEAQGQSYLLGIGIDISKRQRTEKELQKKNAEMEQFIYTVSHDLRSPLVTVKTFMGYLEKDMVEGNQKQLEQDFQFIHSAADKMKLLLDELLEMSRIGRIESQEIRVSLLEVVAEALDDLAGDISERKVDIHLPETDLILLGDRQRLCQIWQNLIENAIKYSRADSIPLIELGVQLMEVETIFFVKDNGIGIDPQYHSKIFGIFEKLDPKSPGAGLGLSMVQRIVETFGGRIWVESEGIDHGSCFSFTLPNAVGHS